MDKSQENSWQATNNGQFPVSVLMQFRESQNKLWSSGQWEVTGLVVGEAGEKITGMTDSSQVISRDIGNGQRLWSGLVVQLHKDDGESYYHNLMCENPKAFIICKSDEIELDQCQPFLVTLSYDEAVSYMEVDELVLSVDMPAELYRWVEQFVLEHYVPEKKRKRKRENWKELSGEGAAK